MSSNTVTPLVEMDQINFTSLTEDTSPDPAADYILTYDKSASAQKKVLLNNLQNTVKFKLLTSGNETHSTAATFNSITPLLVAVKANVNYRIRWYISYTSAAGTTGFKYRLLPSSGTMNGLTTADTTNFARLSINSNVGAYMNVATLSGTVTSSGTYISNPALATIDAILTNSTDANIDFQFSTEIDTSLVTVYNYSCVEYEVLGEDFRK